MTSTRGGDKPIPKHAHPLVRQLIRLANEREMSFRQIGEKSCQHHQLLSNWLHRSNPRIDTFEAALNVLGYELHIRKQRA